MHKCAEMFEIPNRARLVWFQGIYISRIAEGGAAHRDSTLRVGDRVISVSTTTPLHLGTVAFTVIKTRLFANRNQFKPAGFKHLE